MMKSFNKALETALDKGMVEKTGKTRYWFTKRFFDSYKLEVDAVLGDPKLDKKTVVESSDHALTMTVLRHIGSEGIDKDHLVEVVHLVKTLRDANPTREAEG